MLTIPLIFRLNVNAIVYKVVKCPEQLPVLYKNYFWANDTIHDHNTRRCADMHKRVVNSRFGYRAIKVLGTRIWNNTPVDIQESSTLSIFRRKLKVKYTKEMCEGN